MNKIPDYYVGPLHGIEARKAVADFQGDNYNLGTALTYIMRAGKKPGNPITQDIRKAIAHLEFELERQELLNTTNNDERNEFPSDLSIQCEGDEASPLSERWTGTVTYPFGEERIIS